MQALLKSLWLSLVIGFNTQKNITKINRILKPLRIPGANQGGFVLYGYIY